MQKAHFVCDPAQKLITVLQKFRVIFRNADCKVHEASFQLLQVAAQCRFILMNKQRIQIIILTRADDITFTRIGSKFFQRQLLLHCLQ